MIACAQASSETGMGAADLHSRTVGWLKVALPLAALAILSTLFLLADRIDTDAAIPYAEVDVEDLARDPRMSVPAYAGTTSDGAGFTLSAAEARPASDTRPAEASSITALLETPDGGQVNIAAALAQVDTTAKTVALTGGVIIETNSGYSVTTDSMLARLDQTGLQSTAPVQVIAPMGTIDAQGFTLSQDAANPSSYLLVFNGGVKLVYHPGG